MNPQPYIAQSDSEIGACFAVFSILRPQVREEHFLPQVRRQQSQGYQILALKVAGDVVSAAGFRLGEFLAWGKALYIDDLTTLPAARGNGHASLLLDWLGAHARHHGCAAVHLDSGYARNDAHRLYLNKGYVLASHHFELKL